MPSVLPPARTGSSTCRVGRPAVEDGQMSGLSRTVPSDSIRAPLPVGRSQTNWQSARERRFCSSVATGDQHEVGLLAVGDLLRQSMDAVQTMATLRSCRSVPAPAGCQSSYQQSDDDEQDLRRGVGLAAHSE